MLFYFYFKLYLQLNFSFKRFLFVKLSMLLRFIAWSFFNLVQTGQPLPLLFEIEHSLQNRFWQMSQYRGSITIYVHYLQHNFCKSYLYWIICSLDPSFYMYLGKQTFFIFSFLFKTCFVCKSAPFWNWTSPSWILDSSIL